MRKLTLSLFALVALTVAAPSAHAEPWPPPNWERVVMYYTGSCDSTSRDINGYFSVDCGGDPYFYGTRSGKWRAITDANCSTYAVNDVYQVCTSGSSCTDSGTWETISQQDWDEGNCP